MNIIGHSYNFNLFAKNNVIKPDSESIYKLMPFIQDGFMPTTAEEINDDGAKLKIIRVEKTIENKNIGIIFSSKFIGVQINSEYKMSKSNILSILTPIFDKLLSLFKGSIGSRVSCVANVIIENDKATDQGIYKKYFNDENVFFEWNLRRAKKTSIHEEKAFNILTINKGKAAKLNSGNLSQIDAIIITSDNNTSPENENIRFGFENTTIFNELLNECLMDTESAMEF